MLSQDDSRLTLTLSILKSTIVLGKRVHYFPPITIVVVLAIATTKTFLLFLLLRPSLDPAVT
jgi:hypothetical protein